MSIKNRLRLLEKVIGCWDAFRVISVANDADQNAEREYYRTETGYQGVIVVMDETDRML